ncbi:MAG: hypothetical protein ABIG60_01550 [Patescibacteria group bacterium]
MKQKRKMILKCPKCIISYEVEAELSSAGPMSRNVIQVPEHERLNTKERCLGSFKKVFGRLIEEE